MLERRAIQSVPEIREMTNIYDKTIRKWIHRFNDFGVCGLFTEIDYSRMIKITDKARKEILRISSISPRALGLKFSTWSLRSIAGYVKEKKIAKEDSKRRWDKPYYCKRYTKKK